ncbi:MAG: hypothetical protein ACRDHL_14150 [Candidatus Promineifilaceae bacterium]
MDVGMLWLDDDKRATLEQKVERAAEYYREKYGQVPELCFVNKAALEEGRLVGAIEVRPAGYMLPHHFLLGLKAA